MDGMWMDCKTCLIVKVIEVTGIDSEGKLLRQMFFSFAFPLFHSVACSVREMINIC